MFWLLKVVAEEEAEMIKEGEVNGGSIHLTPLNHKEDPIGDPIPAKSPFLILSQEMSPQDPLVFS